METVLALLSSWPIDLCPSVSHPLQPALPPSPPTLKPESSSWCLRDVGQVDESADISKAPALCTSTELLLSPCNEGEGNVFSIPPPGIATKRTSLEREGTLILSHGVLVRMSPPLPETAALCGWLYLSEMAYAKKGGNPSVRGGCRGKIKPLQKNPRICSFFLVENCTKKSKSDSFGCHRTWLGDFAEGLNVGDSGGGAAFTF